MTTIENKFPVERDFNKIRMCFVNHNDCEKACSNYLKCSKYLEDESKVNITQYKK